MTNLRRGGTRPSKGRGGSRRGSPPPPLSETLRGAVERVYGVLQQEEVSHRDLLNVLTDLWIAESATNGLLDEFEEWASY